MAVTKDDLIIAIQIESGKTAAEIAKVSAELNQLKGSLKETADSSKETASAVSGIGFGLVKLQAAIEVARIAYDVYKRTIGDTVKSYMSAIDAERKLANALAINGRFTEEAVARFKDFGAEMQRNSTLADDFVLDLAAQATATGRTEEQTKALIKAAAGLAAMTGKDVKTAFDALLNTYKGVTRGVEVLDPSIKGLTEAQARNGEVVDIVAGKYGAFAKEDMTTVEGKAKVLANLFDDLKESIGEVVAKIFNLGSGTKELNKLIIELTDFINKNKTSIIDWGKTFISVINDLVTVWFMFRDVVAGVLKGITILVNENVLTVQKALNMLGAVDDATVKETESRIASLAKGIEENVQSFRDGLDSIGKVGNTDLEKVNTSIGNTTKAAETLQAGFKGAGTSAAEMSDKAKSAMEDLAKFIADVTAKVDQIGIGRAGQIEAQAKAQREQLKVIADKAKAEGVALSVIEAQVAEAERLIKVQADRTLDADRLAAAKQLAEENKALADQNKQAGMFAADLIDHQLEQQLLALEAKREELKFQGLLNEGMEQQLNDQAELLKAGAAKAKETAPRKEFEQAEQFGKVLSKDIEGAFAGAMGFASGLGSAVAAAQAVVNFIPQLLDSITGLVDSITDLPTVLMDAVKNLLNSLDRFVAEFIPRLIAAIDGILEAIVGFVEKLPETFAQMLEKLPEMLTGLIDKLPDLIERFITAMITAAPKIAMALIEFMVNDAPRIAFQLVKYMATELPKALVKGIAEGLKQIFSGGLLKMPKIPIDEVLPVKDIVKNMKHAFKQLSGETSKLFAVQDITDAGPAAVKKGQDIIEKVSKAGTEVLKKSKDFWDFLKGLWDKLMQGLKDVWMFIYNTFLKPFIDLLKATFDIGVSLFKAVIEVFKVAWDTAVKAFRLAIDYIKVGFEAATKILKAVWDVMWLSAKAIWDGFMQVFTNVWNYVKALWDTLMAVFTGKISLLEGVSQIFRQTGEYMSAQLRAVSDTFRSVFQIGSDGLREVANVFTNLLNQLRDIFNSAFKVFGDAVWRIGNIFDQTFDPIVYAFSSAVNGFKNFGESLINAFNRIIDPFRKLADALGNFSFSGGSVGGFFSKLGFAEGGIVGGRAVVSGDSRMNDKVMAFLSPGEAVIPRSVMQDPFLSEVVKNMLAERPMMQFAQGGMVDFEVKRQASPMLATGTGGSSQTNVYNINQNIKIENSGGQLDENFVRNRLMPAIRDNLRRESLDGKLTISSRGIF